MWFIQEDLLGTARECLSERFLKRCRCWKWRIVKGGKTFVDLFFSCFLNFTNVLGTFEHLLAFSRSFYRFSFFLLTEAFLSLLEFFTPFTFVTHSDLQIHKLVAGMSKHAMVSSFLLWWLIRFPRKKKKQNFPDMKDLTWNLQRFTWIFMFFVASTDFIWIWNLRACCANGWSIKESTNLYCFVRLDFISSPASWGLYRTVQERKNMLSFMFVTYILWQPESFFCFLTILLDVAKLAEHKG